MFGLGGGEIILILFIILLLFGAKKLPELAKGLGKGIDAILPYEAKFCEIAIVDIETNPFQPRINFDGEAINELAESIRKLESSNLLQ